MRGKVEDILFVNLACSGNHSPGEKSMEDLRDATNVREKMISHIRKLSDSELKTALKKRKLYQPEAAVMLVEEALLRGVIRSEQDLTLPEFETPPSKFTLFPVPDSVIAREKILKSLMRSIMLAAIIPVYQGIMKLTLDKYAEGIGLISLGMLWIALAWFIMEKKEQKLITPMVVLALLSVFYAGRILYYAGHLNWTDILIPVILWIFIFYALLYTRILFRSENNPGKK